MTGRERILSLILAGAVVAAGGYYAYRFERPSPPPVASSGGAVSLSPALSAELAQIRAAEKIEDPEQRCLHYPDPPELHWKRSVVEAFCRLKARRLTLLWPDIVAALARHDTALLQRTFDGYLARTYQPGEHGFITWAYAMQFDHANDEERTVTTQWIEEDPSSGYAFAARGIHYVAAAYFARGTALTKDTPPENFDRMRDLAEKSRTDLEQALKLNPRLIVVYDGLLQLSRLSGDYGLRERAVHEALKLDPADHWIYDAWIEAADPRWGGTAEEVAHAARASVRHAQDNPLLLRNKNIVECKEARRMSCVGCGGKPDFAGAQVLFRKSAEGAPSACFLESAPYVEMENGDSEAALRYYSQAIRFLDSEYAIVQRAELLHRAGLRDWALEDVNALMARDPRYADGFDHQGYLLREAKRPKEAETAYLAMLALEPDSERAALQLCSLYVNELKTPAKAAPLADRLLAHNPKLALAWLFKSVAVKGDEVAFREALENFLKYVDRNDANLRPDVARAERQLRQLDHKT